MIEEKSHRIFIAIPISEALQNQALNFRKNYKNLPVRWLSGKNLHITLVPPWYTHDIASVKEKLESLKGKISPFNVKFENISFGPNLSEPRLIWASGKTPPQIIELKNLSEKVLSEKNFGEKALNRQPENRPFILHLTLARFRPEEFRRALSGERKARARSVGEQSGSASCEPKRALSIKTLDEKIDWVENINSIVLMESHLSQQGADYEILQTICIEA